MRVAIVGAGAMGGVYGAALHAGGVDTTLVDVSVAVCEAVRRSGVVVERDGRIEAVPVPITSDPAAVGAVDVVIVFTKCYHTEAAARLAVPLVGPDTAVVSLQNGWGHGDVLAAAFGAERVCLGVSYHSATSLAPGCVVHSTAGPTVLGPLAGADELASRTRDVLVAAGLEVRLEPGVRHEIWKKLTLNAASLPTAALTGLTAGALVVPGRMRGLVDAVARETVAVGRAAGFEVDEAERLATIHDLLARAGTGKASMLQDAEAGRRTEIDVINGAVVRVGAEQGVPTPLNSALVALIEGYERARGLR